ncbi:agmatine deiminase family protein [Arenimonas sp.]|uniref:agmatine deiminase family protein n=1 Tax=Arenimonas sp. TaxID=1872635 RepID=UPI0039E2967D
MVDSLRFPAEWEPQSAVLIAWPHAGTDWAERLPDVETTYVALVAAITRFQRTVVCVQDAALRSHAEDMLAGAGVDLSKVRFETLPYNDTWLRDSGPITLRSSDGFHLLDFHFTAWGGKFEAGLDDRIVSELHARGLFQRAERERIHFALEGGAIETDGQGGLLSTWHCLHERHPDSSREEITAKLQDWLRQDRTLWLDHGYLEGDDTDAHIDTLARFAGPDAIVYQGCQDPLDSHYTELQAMASELAAFGTREGKPYRLFELPWAKPILDEGRRLAASYANFLIVNGAVLMPAYGDAADAAAVEVLRLAFPDREIVAIPCRSLIWQNGSLHCITMQLPEGLVA